MKIKQVGNIIIRNKEIILRISYVFFFIYSCLIIWEVFIGPYRSYSGVRRYNLYPFKTILDYFMNSEKYSFHLLFINLAANIVTFIPLGFFLALFFKRFRNIMATALTIITIIEILQFVINVGVFDIDDIFLNTLGSILGNKFYKIIKFIVDKTKD